MASQDKDEESSRPGASQMGPWDAILEAVREQLPSLDSDSSLSDCGAEELFIFQRDHTALIPDLSEELAEDPARAWLATVHGSPEVCRRQPGAVPVEAGAEPWREWGSRTEASTSLLDGDPGGSGESCGETSSLLRVPEDTPKWQEGSHGAVSLSTQGPRQGAQGEATLSPWEGDLKTEPQSAASQACRGTDYANRRALRKERRKIIEKDILHKVTWAAQDPACGDLSQVEQAPRAAAAALRPETPAEGPQEGRLVLSLQQLEEWDLDHLLQSLAGQEEDRGDRAPGATWWAADRLGRDRTLLNTPDRLMERLTLLCATQSRASSAWKAPADTPQDTKQEKTSSRTTPMGPGLQAKLGLTLAEGLQLRGPTEPPTVFIDLRPTEPSDLRSSERYWDSSSSSSDSEEEEETVALGDQQGPAEQERHSSRGLRDCTGKSQLLQQLRAFRKGTAQPNLLATEGPGGQKSQVLEDIASSGTGRKQHPPAEKQITQTRPPDTSPKALGDPLGPGTVREAWVLPLGQL
uniref:Dynein axonemal assembly factor 8 n=1 Tax=Suricata suricatta TaxID=37032 RepID=A0A673T4V8_SURSU